MASRQNREARDDAPSYGAPVDRQPTDEQKRKRDEERRRKLGKKPTAEERRKRIEEQVTRGREETAKVRRRDEPTQAPRKPGERVTDPEGKSVTEILEGRKRDIDDTLTEIETGKARPQRETDAARRRREAREREEASKRVRPRAKQ